MNSLQDLRNALTTRATDIDDAADLLPGVRHKIRRTRQVRLATAGTVVGLAALAVAVVPGVMSTSTPDPADQRPADYTQNGVTLPGDYLGNHLLKGWAGTKGQTRVVFSWTPTTKNISWYPMCSSPTSSEHRSYWIRVNGRTALTGECNTRHKTPDSGPAFLQDDAWWRGVPLDKPAQVTIDLVDRAGRTVSETDAQLALGIYRIPPSMPAPRPTDPADYVKDGVRFRARFGGERLAAATIGEPGQNRIALSYTATGGPILLRPFSTAGYFTFESQHSIQVELPGQRPVRLHGDGSVDPNFKPPATPYDGGRKGEPITATATLVDAKGKPISVPGAQIGLAVYVQGPQRVVAEGLGLDEVLEFGGKVYRLAEVRAADATNPRKLQLTAPDTAHLITTARTDLGDPDTAGILTGPGLDQAVLGPAADRLHEERPAGLAGPVSLAITNGKPTKGTYALALYLPV